jgi:hypothetical protein
MSKPLSWLPVRSTGCWKGWRGKHDHGAHDPLAELGFRDEHSLQSLRRDYQRLDLALCTAVDVMATWPASITSMPGPGWPVSNNTSPSA